MFNVNTFGKFKCYALSLQCSMSTHLVSLSVMHYHCKVEALDLPHSCPECKRTFPTRRGLAVHQARWCRPGQRPASRRGQLADKAVKLAKRKASAALLPPVVMEVEALESVYQFDYLGCRFTSDGDDAADMRHRITIAGERSRSLDYLWHDNRLPWSLKLRLYAASVCSTLTHGSEAWMLTPRALAMLNGFNPGSYIASPGGRIAMRPPRLRTTFCRLCGREGISGWAISCECLATAYCTVRCWRWVNKLDRPGSLLMDTPLPLPELIMRAADRRGWARDSRSLSCLQESP